MKILITGGAGFIGSNFSEYLLSATDHSVIVLDALTYAGRKSNLEGFWGHPQMTFIKGDIRDASLVNSLMEQVDAVINFAAESHVDRSVKDAAPFASTNVVGIQTLLEAASEYSVDRFIQISTDEVYGQIFEGKFREADQLHPRNPYSATKAGAELLAQSYEITKDVPVIITRASNTFGPRQHTEKFIPRLITCISDGETFPLYGDGDQIRDWIFVTDHCRAIHTVLENGEVGEVYNVGAQNERQNIQVVETLLDMLDGSTDNIEHVEDRPAHDYRYAMETDKIEALGWEPQVSFDTGLRQTVEYYL